MLLKLYANKQKRAKYCEAEILLIKTYIEFNFKELSEGYDALPEKKKNKIPIAESTGFMTNDGERRYIIDQNTQLDLKSMKWFSKDNLDKNTNLLIAFSMQCNQYINTYICAVF